MKKWIAMLLSMTLLLPFGAMIGSAAASPAADDTQADGGVTVASSLEAAFAEDENSLLVFVTGIGQSTSYLFDDSYVQPGAFASGTLQDYENYAQLIADGKYKSRWNLFTTDYDEALAKKETKQAIVHLIMQVLITLFVRKNVVKEEDIRTLMSNLWAYNLVDENGDQDPRVVTPRYPCPVSQYPYGTDENGNRYSEARNRFYTSIPCEDVAREKLGPNFEDYLYCFNFSPFSYTTKNVDGLHEYIETILATNKVGATKVVLIPMSMGASVVSAYLAKYPNVADNHVRRVVSIVGCWNGSDIIMDLIRKDYADNSADLFYNGLIAELVGEPWGYVVNVALRLFSKAALRSLIDEALGVFVDVIFLHTPSLSVLVPDRCYEEVRPLITSEAVLKETDFYYQAQSTLKSRLAALSGQGVGFSFIAGYGLPYGAVTHDYRVFGFLHSAERTNSDEIINIDSTAPGTSYVAYNAAFGDTAGRTLSPDGSIDASTAYYKDSCWYFYKQKHELEYNNTALSLAVSLALGTIKTTADCDNLAEDGVLFPQFNGARNLRDLQRDYLPAYERYIAGGGAVTPAQAALYEDVIAMTKNTVNDYEADNALIARFADMLVEIGAREPAQQPSRFSQFFTAVLEKNNSFVNSVFGSKGFLDFTK